VLANFKQPTNQQTLKVLKHWVCQATHNIQVFLSEFKGSFFKSNVARRVLQEKPKVNMYKMPLAINEDVAVVSILHIKQVGENCITSQTFHEVLLGTLVVILKVLLIKGCQRPIFLWKLLLEIVD
jgi:hypothetical protein